MKISYKKNVPEMEIFNDRTEVVLIEVSHNGKDFSRKQPISVGETKKLVDVKLLEIVVNKSNMV